MPQVAADYITRALRETLDSVVSPQLRERMVQAALEAAAMAHLPGHPASFRQFLEGPLRESVLRTLGPELGGSVMNELAAVLTAAERDLAARSSRRPVVPAEAAEGAAPQAAPQTPPPPSYTPVSTQMPGDVRRPTLPSPAGSSPPESTAVPCETPPIPDSGRGERTSPVSRSFPLGMANALAVVGTASVAPASSSRMPMVLISSNEANLVRSFGEWLDPRITVQRVRTVVAIFQALAVAGSRRVVIVLDARAPSVRPLAMAAVADDLPANVRVVLWGVSSDVHSKMSLVSSAVASWLVCGTELTTSEVVEQCTRLVG